MTTIAVTHKNMDFDALASLTAAVLLFPDAMPLMPKTVNPNVKAFLSLHKDAFPGTASTRSSRIKMSTGLSLSIPPVGSAFRE